MLITSANLNAIRVGFKTSFQSGLGQAKSQYGRLATVVTSSTAEEKYGWIGQVPRVREWIGPRHVQGLAEHDYEIKNKDWELTIGVARNAIADDRLGIFSPLFEEMGRSTGAHYDELVFGLLKTAFASRCYDGQYYFDTDHPVLDEAGIAQSVANTDGGSGAPWFLFATASALKPIILQKRQEFTFVARDNPTDQNVFDNKEFRYGADARCNVGFGFWQLAWGSKQTLDAVHYETARSALLSMKGDYGRPLGLVPDLLVVSPTLEGAANRLLKNIVKANGETNEWAGTAEVMVVPWLA